MSRGDHLDKNTEWRETSDELEIKQECWMTSDDDDERRKLAPTRTFFHVLKLYTVGMCTQQRVLINVFNLKEM